MDTMRVVFRADRSGEEITAVFPDEVGTWCDDMMCYAHIGQHVSCSLAWYRTTRPATPEEYAPLLQELRRIYETGPDAVKLVVGKRR